MQENNGLDKKQLISFGLFSLILFGFMMYFMNREQPKEMPKKAETAQVPPPIKASPAVPAGQIQETYIENDKLKLGFSGLGGQINYVELKDFKAYNPKTDEDDLPLNIWDKKNSAYGFIVKNSKGQSIDTRNIVFTPTVKGNTVQMTGVSGSSQITYTYSLSNSYDVTYQVSVTDIAPNTPAQFAWNFQPRQMEKGRNQEQSHSEFVYSLDNYSSYDYDASSGLDETGEKLDWIGIKQQFFTSVLETDAKFTNTVGSQEMLENGSYLKKFDVKADIATSGNSFQKNFTWHFMPLDLNLLKSYDKNFDEILPLGWSFIGSLNRYFFMFLYNTLSSWGITAGWVIFLMTIIVKIILSPIMYKQHKLSAMMRVIRPEIDEVNAKYKDADPMKKQQEVMAVYRKAGVNQLAGCLPALIQIPIFYALFRFFPNMLNLRGESFWFAKDLTAYDDVIKLPFTIPFLGDHLSIFAIACTAVILIYTMLTAGNIQQPTQEGMPNMKVLMYIFPITFLFFLNTSASGLSWYYFVSNAINIVIILVIKYWILDEKKIHAQIQMNKEKPKKEGKFQKRMREMMEKAQEQQKLAEQQRNKRK